MVAGDANCETRVSFGDGAREEGVGVAQRRGLGDPYSLVDMVVVQRVARVREERWGALWGSAPPATTMAPFGLWAFKMVVLCVFSDILCCFLLLYGVK